MKSLFTPQLVDCACIRILQITDSHLFSDPSRTLLGVNTWQSYQAVLEAIKSEEKSIDLIVATGDLVQDHTLEGYRHFAAGIAGLSAPCVWLPGNHDVQPLMEEGLMAANLSAHKQILLGEEWQILLLDSQVHGSAHGSLSDEQLGWLARSLASEPHRHTLVMLHHHPLASGCDWLDNHQLDNAEQLAAVLADYPLVNTLICGHIHQELDLQWQGWRVLATPSTCVQFRPKSADFSIDDAAPGWRWLELLPAGVLRSEVVRLTNHRFAPDFAARGY